MPIYQYEHPDTGEIFEILKSIKDRDKPHMSDDGKKCKRVLFPTATGGKKGRASRAGMKLECFEADPRYTKDIKPKYVRFRDGHRERYDPTKHC